MRDRYDDIETVLWVGGILMFSAGCGFMWGWPATLISFGSFWAFWPLVKQLARR